MKKPKLLFLSAMGIFGTIGIFVKYIPLNSALIAFCRGVMGVAFLAFVMLLTRKRPDKAAIKKNLPILFLSGAAIGFNWILLFESYNHTTVATATVCYYFAPLFLLLASPLLGERLTLRKLLCIGIALVGLILVSGVTEGSLPNMQEIEGILFGVGAALLYATVMLLNKKLSPIPAYDKTILQLGSAALVLLPYLMFNGSIVFPPLSGVQWLLLCLVGILHTGIAYTMYFGAMKDLPAKTIAIFSYLDPVIAVILSAVLLHETITPWGIAGSVLILGSALYSELPEKK